LIRTAAILVSVCAALLAVAGCSRQDQAAHSQAARSLAAASPGPVAAGEGRRIALVVGNSHYASSPLTNPVNDAELVAMSLMQVGFEVRLVTDGDQRAMKRAIQEFGETLEKAGSSAVGLFYYAGHGVQMGGRNYLIPVGASIERDSDVDIEAVSADWVIEQMRFAHNRLNFVILDACRNNPFVRSFRSGDRGLAKMDAPAGVLIAYSTAPGDVAADGSGRNSPYSEALASAVRDSVEPAELMFKRVRDQVREVTTERQTPWESSSLTGENFYFARRAPVAPVQREDAAPTRETPLTSNGAAVAVAPASPAVQNAGTLARAEPEAAPAPAPAFQESGSSIVVSPDFNPDTAPGDLCTRATGEWRMESGKISGTVRLNADHGGTLTLKSGKVRPVTWSCDLPNRHIKVRYDELTVHVGTIDGIERWIFGSDQDNGSVDYHR
jgi:uncharacterized caspase-like protein